jgi:inner membrane protein
MSLDSTTIWFLVGLILVLLEFAAPGVILVFIGLGAWVTALAVRLGWAETLDLQMMWFAGSSVVLLLALRRVFKGWFTGFSVSRDTRANLDEFTGKEVVVLSPVEVGGRGLVEFKGANWAARLAAGETMPFESGERAIIQAVDGLCLLITKPRSE